MAQYDLTNRIGQYMDRHMIFPLLEFLSHHEIYSSDELVQAHYDLLSETNMVDYANEIYRQIHNIDTCSPVYEERRTQVLARLEELGEESAEIMSIIQDPDVVKQLKQDKLQNIQFLKENHNFKPEMLQNLYNFAKFQYNCGNYSGAAEMLYHFRILSTDENMNLQALWGKLASEILTTNWESALDDLKKLKDAIDQKTFPSHLQQLQQRTWLIHWSLFVFFNHPNGRDLIIDMFFQPQYINTIQISCPWVLRYLSAAVITSKKRRNVLKDLVKVIQQESCAYKDPIIEFIECLYINFDFNGAKNKLKECEDVLYNDFFLVATKEDFIEAGRLIIFETYCKIHQNININKMSELLNLEQETGEKWIANLIRNARLDAKIDVKTNTVIMGSPNQSIYQKVIEETVGLTFRSNVIASNIEKRQTYQNFNKNKQQNKNKGNKKQQQQKQ